MKEKRILTLVIPKISRAINSPLSIILFKVTKIHTAKDIGIANITEEGYMYKIKAMTSFKLNPLFIITFVKLTVFPTIEIKEINKIVVRNTENKSKKIYLSINLNLKIFILKKILHIL